MFKEKEGNERQNNQFLRGDLMKGVWKTRSLLRERECVFVLRPLLLPVEELGRGL